MTGYQEFRTEYDNLQAAFRANSRGVDEAYAKMVGALGAIVPMLADDHSLRVMAQAMREATKRETFSILSQ